ncbi:MAG TPA: cobalt ECF transporter T component CbiQ [Bauldia sp.]|nr:cobalt ECF transporter T component CbiQ [Bauldia sp.]
MSEAAPRWTVADDAPGAVVAALDPRVRLVLALAVVATVIALSSPLALVAAIALAGALVALARLPAGATLRRLMHVEGFLLLLLVLLPFTTPGTPALAFGPLTASAEGIARAVGIVLRVNAAVLATFALVGGLEPVRAGRAAARLGVPEKLVHLFLFAVRYVGVFRAETVRLVEAMRVRGFVAGSNRHTWRSLGNLVGMILVRSIERAERVEEAMRCRGYSGRLPHAPATPLAPRDHAFATATILALAALLALDRLL